MKKVKFMEVPLSALPVLIAGGQAANGNELEKQQINETKIIHEYVLNTFNVDIASEQFRNYHIEDVLNEEELEVLKDFIENRSSETSSKGRAWCSIQE